jgi:uracil-DNA glycosylase
MQLSAEECQIWEGPAVTDTRNLADWIRTFQPQWIVAFGAEATAFLAGIPNATESLGQFLPLAPHFDFAYCTLLSTHSWEALATQPHAKRETWNHLKDVMARLPRA